MSQRLLEYLERLHDCSTIDEVWSNHVKQMDEFGFDRLLYGFTRYRTPNSFGDQQDRLVLSNHSEDYIRDFVDSELYYHAPMVTWSANNVGACSWSTVIGDPNTLSDVEKRIVDFNKKYGLTAGYGISFKDISSRAKGAIGLVAKPGIDQDEVDRIWARDGREIVQMNNSAHLRITSLPYSTLRRPLTSRQREVLEWVGDGKTTQDIATIMGLTPATIEKHLRLAREALDVDTTAQAVLKASYQNQIFTIPAEQG